jgi:hypothetical protein
MSAAVISFAEARHARGLEPQRLAIRLGDAVRRRDSLAEGTVLGFKGSGAPDDPVRALVQFSCACAVISLVELEAAPPKFDPPKGAA